MPGPGTARFVLKGGDDLERRLRRLDDKMEKKIKKQAVKAAGKPIVTAARALVRRESGILAESLGSFTRTYRGGSTVAIVGPRRRFRVRQKVELTGASKGREPANYAHLVEGGTKPHFMPKAVIGGVVLTAFQHPGTRPRRFMEPAWDANKNKALRVMAKKLDAGIAKVAKL